MPDEVQAVRIVPDIPVIFSDGVISHSFIPGIAKFYLYRTDIAPDVAEGHKNIAVAQVVMSAQGFANMLHFLEHRLKLMIKHNAISQEDVDKINSLVYSDPMANSK